MSNKNKNTATEAVAVLKSNLDSAELAFNAIKETATAEEKQAAQTAFDASKTALEAIPETATAEEKQAAQTAFNEAETALNAIKELPTPEEKEVIETAFNEAKTAYETAAASKGAKPATVPKAEKEKLTKGVFIVSPTGRFNLAYNVGEDAELPDLQAKELEEAGYFRINK